MTAHDDESSEFRDALGTVRPRRSAEHISQVRRPPPARARQREADEQAVLGELLAEPDLQEMESGDTLSYRAQGVQDSVLRRLRRGHYRIEGELDLHGLNRSGAQAAVSAFLAHSLDRDRRCVRIIHGKGNGSPNSGPVLKASLDGWLRRRREVLAFCSARATDGGTGAVYVLLRARP
jgi:DNA-nicking Smr family endonuclease